MTDNERSNVEAATSERKRVLDPLGDRIIVRIVKDAEVTAGGVILPDSVRERSQRGIVIGVGPGRVEMGQRMPIDLEPGDVVLFSKYGGTELPEGMEERDPLLVLREADVLCRERFEGGERSALGEGSDPIGWEPEPARPDPLKDGE